MGQAESGHASFRRGACNRDCTIEEKIPAKKGIGQCDRIRVDRRDDVCAWSQVLSAAEKERQMKKSQTARQTS